MAFDYEMATKGMINAINMYSQSQTQRSNIENSMMMDEVKRKRTEEDWIKKQNYMSPMERAFTRKYFKENPSEISDFQGIPGVGMEARSAKKEIQQKGTGGPATTSQGVSAPSTFTPQDPQRKTVEMTSKGFGPMKPESQLFVELQRKAQETPHLLTVKEKKLIGTLGKEATKLTTEKQVYANIANKGIVDSKGELNEFMDRSDAELYVTSKLGTEWKKKFPQATQMLDAKYGPSIDEFKRIIKANNIQDKRSAIEYLVNSLGMDRQEAIDWIDENN